MPWSCVDKASRMAARSAARALFASLLLCLAATGARAGYNFGPLSDEFKLFSTPSAWDIGPNTARIGGSPAPGGATFSIVPAGLKGARGVDTAHAGNKTVDILELGLPDFTVEDYAALVHDALNVWAAASGFTNLGQVADGGVDGGTLTSKGGHLGDIRVAAWEIPTEHTLAHAYQPGNDDVLGMRGTIGGDVHIDVGTVWGDDPNDGTGDPDFDLFTVVLHELGHALGLDHSDLSGSVMEPVYGGARRSLHADDRAGVWILYGSVPALLSTGDVNRDGPVDDVDLNLVLSDLGLRYGQLELDAVVANIGGGGDQALAPRDVPEPRAFDLAVLAFAVSLVFSQRRKWFFASCRLDR